MASKKGRSKKAARKKKTGGRKKASARKAGARKPAARKAEQAAPGRGTPELDRLASLLVLMREHDLVELELGPDTLRLSKAAGVQAAPMAAPVAAPVPAVAAAADAGAPAAVPSPDSNLDTFPSPMVGTFYRAPSPEVDPYVVEGDRVSSNSTLCIIEAMKVFNEIKAETSGVIAEVLVENGEAVEYGQPLFTLEKA